MAPGGDEGLDGQSESGVEHVPAIFAGRTLLDCTLDCKVEVPHQLDQCCDAVKLHQACNWRERLDWHYRK